MYKLLVRNVISDSIKGVKLRSFQRLEHHNSKYERPLFTIDSYNVYTQVEDNKPINYLLLAIIQ